MSVTPAPTPTRSERSVIAYLAATGMLLALGIDIALPAIDEMRPAFGLAADSNRITLVVTVYFIGMGFGQLIWGPVADRFGRMTTMNVGVGLYIVCALGAALAPNLTVLLLLRGLWGVGAAAPAGLRTAIARDLYSGDQMARIMSLVMAVFMIGPIIAPLVGEVILLVSDWQMVFVFCAVAGVFQTIWSRRFGETLNEADRQPLEFAATKAAFRRVINTRVTIRYTLAYAMSSGAFLIFLGSTQPIMDRIYGRSGQFALVFSGAGLSMAAAFVIVNAMIKRVGARTTARTGAGLFVIAAAIHLAFVLAADGTPNFWVWVVPVVLMNLLATPLGPSCFTLGLVPMGDLAGTASGVMGFLSLVIGASLAAIADGLIGDTVTPMSVAYLVYGTASLLFLRSADPKPEPPRASAQGAALTSAIGAAD